MSTSLAEQLRKLAVPQSRTLIGSKKRPSLLFDPAEAAKLSKETFYQIGLDGLSELINKNAIFAEFENNLFNVSSKDFERSVETKESNAKLNKSIKSFLNYLSPYFLLTAAHKAIEWLIHRYYIEEYNKDDLLMLVFPYHETNIFVRVLQLIKIEENDRWIWLKPLQKPGLHLTKSVLYTHAASDPFFLKFISDHLLETKMHIKQTTLLNLKLNFYCATFTGALESADKINENHVVHTIPSIMKGLSSDNIDFCAAVYIVLSKLLTRSTLTDKILNKLVDKITDVDYFPLRSQTILLLVLLYQSQEQFTTINKTAVKHLTKMAWFGKSVQDLANSGYCVAPLVNVVLLHSVQMAVDEVSTNIFKKFTSELLGQLKLSEGSVIQLLNKILEAYDLELTYPEETQQWLISFISGIETQYPLIFDHFVNNILKKSDDATIVTKQRVFETITLDMSFKKKIDLLEKMYHPSAGMRKVAVKNLIKEYQALSSRDKGFIRDALIDRFNDDDADVILEAVQIPEKILLDIIDEDLLLPNLIRLLVKSRKNEYTKVTLSALKLLCMIDSGDNIEVFLVMLPYLLPLNEGCLNHAKIIVDSAYANKSLYIKQIVTKLRSMDSEKMFKLVYSHLGSLNNIIKYEELLSLVQNSQHNDVLVKYLSILLLTYCSMDSKSILKTLKCIIKVTNETNSKGFQNDDEPKSLIKCAYNSLPLDGVLECIERLINKSQIKDNLASLDFYDNNEINEFILTVFDMLLKGSFTAKESSNYTKTIKVFFKKFCNNNYDNRIAFLTNIFACESKFVNDSFKLRVGRTLHELLRSEKLKNEERFVVPYLLVVCQHKIKEIRALALEICVILANSMKNSYISILNGLLVHKTDIIMDEQQVPMAILNLYETKNSLSDTLLSLLLAKVPIYLQSGIIKAFSMIKVPEIYAKLTDVAYNILNSECTSLNSQHSLIIHSCIQQFDNTLAETLTLNTGIWKFIEKCINYDKNHLILENEELGSPSYLLLTKINRQLYATFNDDVKTKILDVIITIAATTKNHEVVYAAGRVFKHIDLDANTILSHLVAMKEIQSAKMKQTTLKRRRSVIPTIDILDTHEWKKGIVVLEFIQDKKKVKNAEALIPILFEILKRCLDFDEQPSVEYPKQLLLSLILYYCDKIDDNKLTDSVFNVELIVQCIRASQNPQTHHHALLLLARVALFVPNQVLHHIMAIFTFMGSSILRHDDAYSFEIIAKIIESVVPILVEDGSEKTIIKVLRVFVDVILDVPEHRRLSLYMKLIMEIGAKDNLHLFLQLIFNAGVIHTDKEKNERLIHIAQTICMELPVEITINACISLMDCLKDMPGEKEEADDFNSDIFDINVRTTKQFRHFKYTFVQFILKVLSSEQFVNKIASLDESDAVNLETLFKEMIILVLKYIKDLSKYLEKYSDTPQAQYWKVLTHHCYDILDSLNALLNPEMFLLVMKGLMVYNINAIKRRSIELLNYKLQHNQEFFTNCKDEDMNAILHTLLTIIKQVHNENLDNDEEVLIQTALLCLKLFTRAFVQRNPDKYVDILNFITDIFKLKGINGNILASVVLCLAELCYNLRAKSIPCLNKFMPTLIKLLKSGKNDEQPTLLLLSAIAALQKIMEVLTLFLSPYLEKLLINLSSLSIKWTDAQDDPKLTPILSKLQSIKSKLGADVPTRVLLPAIEAAYQDILKHEEYAKINYLMIVLSESVNHLQGIEKKTLMPDLVNLFLNALQFRSDYQCDHEQANKVETHVINAFTVFTLKLSEIHFRPIYYKLYDWAIRSNSRNERIITFYALSQSIANSLKGLFVLFAGHFWNNAAEVLDACNANKQDSLYFADDEMNNIALIENVLKTLECVCMYDNQKFMNKERFGVLMQPVVDQLDNQLGDYEERARKLVIPCLVYFSVATADDALWKQMNYQILLKMRDSNPNIRLIALECLSEICKKLGEDFLPLLPETIPFLAELLEDEEEMVEKACQRTVQELEKVLGEPLQKYF